MISLRIVGIFYNNPNLLVPLNASGKATVQNVLDAAVATPTGTVSTSKFATAFGYGAIPFGSGQSVHTFYASYNGKFTSPSSPMEYGPGEFASTEVKMPGSESVWQYYSFDKDGKNLNSLGFIPFDQAEVPDGGTVIWRLIQILTAPTGLSQNVRRSLTVTPSKQSADASI